MNSLGIYFGPTLINIVESKGKKPLNNIQIPHTTVALGELEQKIPDDVKIVALFKEELRKNKIESTEATVCLAGRDLIIRTFEMPPLPRNELESAVAYEAKKYIPFKTEELVSAFQSKFDRSIRKDLILFMGIKKATLEKYLSILNQLNIKVTGIEYSAFSILRFLKLGGISYKGVVAIIGADFQEEEEVIFTVLEDGFALFSRDITLLGTPDELSGPAESSPSAMTMDKLKSEIRVSLDYYNRKFPTKRIQKVFLISAQNYRSDLELFIREIGFSAQFIDIGKYNIGKQDSFSLGFIKSYSSSLSRIIKTTLKTNLLIPKPKPTSAQEVAVVPEPGTLFSGIKINPITVMAGLLICFITAGFGIYRSLILNKELKGIIQGRPVISTINPDSTFDELTTKEKEYKARLNTLNNIINNQLFLTKILDAIPRVMPDGIWLTDLSFGKENEDRAELTLKGIAYVNNSDLEFDLVNQFLANINDNAVFKGYFKEIEIVTLERRPFKKNTAINFTIACRRI